MVFVFVTFSCLYMYTSVLYVLIQQIDRRGTVIVFNETESSLGNESKKKNDGNKKNREQKARIGQ